MKQFAAVVIALILTGPVRAEPPADGGVSLNFQNADIDLVLKFFSEVTGNVFIKSDSVRGFISVIAPGKSSPEQAMDILRAVLDVKGFTLVPGPGKIMKVLSQSEAAQGELDVGFGSTEIPAGGSDRMISQVIPLRFVSATDIKTEMAPLLSKAGSVMSDERTNSLVVTDMGSNIRRLLKMISSLDVRTPQVLIEALIMEVSLTDETKLGLEWGRTSSFQSGSHRFQGELKQDFGMGSFISEGLKYSILRDDGNLSAVVQALATHQKVNILSTPHILTLNNQPAMIRVGEEVPVLTQTRNVQGGETIRSFDFKSVAIELDVTPRINVDREVFLKVHPSVKKILGTNSELNAPILATREADTSVIIKDGETVVIGGLMKDDRSSSASKIPLLGDIPILGALFRSKGTTNDKTELLVFITPRVILDSSEARSMTIHKEAETKEPRAPHRQDALNHLKRGKQLLAQKHFDEAIQEFSLAEDNSPDEKTARVAERWLERAKKKAAIHG